MTGRGYALYVPAGYQPGSDQSWALVVSCHDEGALSNANEELQAWASVAERQGFLVAAPEFDRLPRDEVKRTYRRREDERVILGIIQAVRASHGVDAHRVFLAGTGAGSATALYVGLRHPEIFRAVSVHKPDIEEGLLESCTPFLDTHQPVQIIREAPSALAELPESSVINWLRQQDAPPTVRERSGVGRYDMGMAYGFFREVIETSPRVRIQVKDDPDDPLAVTLRTQTSFTPVRVQWDLGDDSGSVDPVCRHRYEQAGTYTVRVAVWDPGGKVYIRRIHLSVRGPRIGE